MNIPDKAIEAAAKAAYDDAFMAHAPDYLPRYDEEDEVVRDSWRKVARVSLDAAAPFIAAQALRDVAEALQAEVSHANPTSAKAWIRAEVAADIRDHAHKLDPQ